MPMITLEDGQRIHVITPVIEKAFKEVTRNRTNDTIKAKEGNMNYLRRLRKSCTNCRFEFHGNCRRYPPPEKALHKNLYHGDHGEQKWNGLCGEYKRRLFNH